MAGKITKNFRLHSAEQFQEQFDESDPSRLYFFISRANPWTEDTNPPEPSDTISDSVYRIWDDMLAMKSISPADVSFGVDRVDWKTGTVYDTYSSESEFYTNNNFHVITDDYRVYKCLDNNNGAASTVKPTGRSLTPLTTSDGYIWKYMFTVTASDALKFSTVKIIPVKRIESDDGSDQWDVQAAAVQGQISATTISTAGTGYTEKVGTVVLGGTNNIRIESSASGIADAYNGYSIYISSGTGAGQLRTIVNYDGSNKTVTVDSPFSPAVNTSSTYIVSPRITFTGDGSGAAGYSRVQTGQIVKVNMINFGSGYNRVEASATANGGAGATLVPQISPPGGHGSDPVSELYAHNVIMNIRMTGSEGNTFPISNDFRTVGLIADPLLANSSPATAINYDQTTKLTISNPSLNFVADEVITGSVSGAEGRFVEYFSNNVISVTGNLIPFSTSDTVTGDSSGATATVDSITVPLLQRYKGKLLYVENRSPISRAADQMEDIKIVVRF